MIKENIAEVLKSVKEAAKDSREVKVVAVGKGFSAEVVNEAIDAGIKAVGENRIQEAEEKFPKLKKCERHMVGHLQSNKAKKAAELFDFVESIDSVKTAEKLSDACIEMKKVMPVLVQVRTDLGKDYGVEIKEIGKFLDDISEFKGIKVKGLMTVPPICEWDQLRGIYSAMGMIFNKLGNSNKYEMQFLSMGMTNDFEVAIQEGANIVRIGRGIFGERELTE
ncbi:MAG: YggS family pyridoxal phosphate-dependent enzyme [Candidatus Diapherotrites archaeon]